MKPDWLHVFPDTNFFFECRDAFDREFIRPTKWEKLVQVHREWREGNRYHSYVSRYVQSGKPDNYLSCNHTSTELVFIIRQF
jgi:hypothetical protein